MTDHEQPSDAEIYPDFETGKIVARFLDPDTGDLAVELHFEPELGREFAFNLTRCSIALEEYGLPR